MLDDLDEDALKKLKLMALLGVGVIIILGVMLFAMDGLKHPRQKNTPPEHMQMR